jgi:putative DNA methylase
MWLWTLKTAENGNGKDEDEEAVSSGGYVLEYDAARKIAQGLGAHLDALATLVAVKGDEARLLPVDERTPFLFGKEDAPTTGGKKKKKRAQKSLFAELDEAEAAEGGWGEGGAPSLGQTTLDRVHQAMLLFASGRGAAMRRFLVEEGAGRDSRFWTLAQALSALYPPNTQEKRWVDGVLARKKGLGF